MVDIDKILLEWSWRCEKGYPDLKTAKDLAVLKQVLKEMNLPNPFTVLAEADDEITDTNSDFTKQYPALAKFYTNLDSSKKIEFEDFISTMPSNLLISFKGTMSTLSKQEIVLFSDAFKSLATVAELNKKDYKPYQKLWDTFVGQAIGKGELFISFFVKDAVVQGSTESFDIGVGSEHYEVKSLDILDSKSGKIKAGNIRPGAEGKVSRFNFTKQLMEFYTLIEELQSPDIRANVMSLGSTSAMKIIVDIIDSVSTKKASGDLITITPGDVPMGMLDQAYKAILQFHDKVGSTSLNKDVTTSRISIKGSSIDSQYWITPEDAKTLASAAGKNQDVNIKVGSAVTDESKEGKIVLADLFNHPFVKDPKNFTSGLKEIKAAFFGDKAGLIYFFKGITHVSSDMSEFATIESSQDGYRFGLVDRYKDKEYIQDQNK